ncbi:CCR4-NOT transcription complex subunit 4 isoform X1 [Esox lucius]|uniref:CCR4-NOT transcription complex subunit 4 n=1 Tax=Esox lucius TaxID=8010 RepID=A0A3P8Y346_ESOLU|nr:CCR4-NOT transcription complex subunit 4 isoform X1 [Esox lucius]
MSCSPEVKDVDPMECPLCMEPLEIDDVNFFPCTCGYQICRFCWHRIRTDENGLCPACRKPYPEDPAVYKPLSAEELQRIRNEKKAKQVEKKQKVTENRKHLASVRVVQRNLVFVVGLSQRLADPEVLKRPEYFGKFGKIHKVVINNSTSYAGSQGPSASAYVTYLRSEDALRAIQSVNNVIVDGRTLKASLGTTKYCSYFLKSMQCPKPDCMYLHELGDEAASFTKEEMQAGKHQEYEQKLLQDLYKNPVFTTQASGGEKTKSSKPSSLQRSNSNSSHGQEVWPSLQPTGKTANGLSSEHRKSPPLDGGGSDSEHMVSDGPECDIGLGSGLSPFSSSCDPSSPSDVLPDVISSSIVQHGILGNGDSSEQHNLLPDCDSPSPPPVHAGPPGFSKPSLMAPISVACLTARSPFEGAAAESQSLFSDNSNFRHPNPIPSTSSRNPQQQDSWPMAPEPHSLFTSDTIPVSSSTDWQAAFGFGSSKQQTSEDDLGFDPFDITRKALADLIEKELSVQDSLPSLSPFHPSHTPIKPGLGPPGGLLPHHNHFSGMNSGLPQNRRFSPMHQHPHPQNRASYSTFSFSGPPSSSTSSSTSNATSRHPWMTSSATVGSAPSRNNFTMHFGNHTASNHTTSNHTASNHTTSNHTTTASLSQHSSFLDLVLPSMSSIQRHNTGVGDIPMTADCSPGDVGATEQHIHIKEWQDGLRALLPNININFGGMPPNSSSSSCSSSSSSGIHHPGVPLGSSGSGPGSGGPGGVSHSLSWDGSFGTASWMDPAIITGIPSAASNSMDSLQDDNPPHWLKSLQALTEMDAAPLPSSASSPQQTNPHGSHGDGPFGGSQFPLQHRPSWAPYLPPPTVPHSPHPAGQFHSPPPGFQTALRAPGQTAQELLQSAGLDRH